MSGGKYAPCANCGSDKHIARYCPKPDKPGKGEMKTHMADESAPEGLVPLCGAKDWDGMTSQWEFVDCGKCLKKKVK